MNRGELIDQVSAMAEINKKQADQVLTATIQVIVDAVAEGEKVTIMGFGIFERRSRKARERRNPKTNEKLYIPATRVPVFSAGKLFKERVAPKGSAT